MKTKKLTVTVDKPLLIAGAGMFFSSRLFCSSENGCPVFSITLEVPEDFNGQMAFSAPPALQREEWKDRDKALVQRVVCGKCGAYPALPIVAIEDVGCEECKALPGCMVMRTMSEVFIAMLKEEKGG